MEMDTSCRTQASRKAYELLSWCVMLTLNTVVFKLILQILRHFYLTPLLYKSTFLHIYPWIYQLAYLHIITKQRFCHLVLLLTVTRRVTKQLRWKNAMSSTFFLNFFLFSITERIKNCTLLTKCHIGCSDKIIYSLFQPFYPRQTFFWMASSSSLEPIPIYLWVTFTLECWSRVLTSSIL